MHYALLVGVIGVLGLIVNSVVFFLIGGYTLHQSEFRSVSKEGNGDDSVISASMRRGPYNHAMRERQGLLEIFRDIFGCVLVIVVAIIVYEWTDDDNADYVDPCLTIITVFVLGVTSYKYAIEAGHILLLTIPDHINVAELQKEMREQFPEVYDIHEFHVWQLTSSKIIASAHVAFQKPQGYLSIQNSIMEFLYDKGMSHVTIQPEFAQETDGQIESPNTLRRRNKCFLPCIAGEDCQDMQCCNEDDDEHDHDFDEVYEDHHHSHGYGLDQHHDGAGNLSQFESISINTSVQNPSIFSGGSGQIGTVLKSESLNNHLDISSLDSSLVIVGAGANNLGNVGEESEEMSDDDEQVQAELRPMI